MHSRGCHQHMSLTCTKAPLKVIADLESLADISLLDAEQTYRNISLLLQEGDAVSDKTAAQHPIKGGYIITDYLTYDWSVC